ncbi:K02A2.6-like, partial [Cordylochernes scorpioides]
MVLILSAQYSHLLVEEVLSLGGVDLVQFVRLVLHSIQPVSLPQVSISFLPHLTVPPGQLIFPLLQVHLPDVPAPTGQCPGAISPSGQCPGAISPSGQCPGAISPSGQCPGAISPSGQCPGAISPSGQCPGAISPSGQCPGAISPSGQCPGAISPSGQCPGAISPSGQCPGAISPSGQCPGAISPSGQCPGAISPSGQCPGAISPSGQCPGAISPSGQCPGAISPSGQCPGAISPSGQCPGAISPSGQCPGAISPSGQCPGAISPSGQCPGAISPSGQCPGAISPSGQCPGAISPSGQCPGAISPSGQCPGAISPSGQCPGAISPSGQCPGAISPSGQCPGAISPSGQCPGAISPSGQCPGAISPSGQCPGAISPSGQCPGAISPSGQCPGAISLSGQCPGAISPSGQCPGAISPSGQCPGAISPSGQCPGAISSSGLISTLQLVKKLDRYPFRKKRKIDSVEQEETTMTIKKEATNQVGSFFIQHLPRNPSMFSGEGSEDPHNWLKKYERVAKHNQWDETLCLANVYFYLTGTALKWFENNEESILTWTEFMSQLKSVFGKNENLRLRAEKTLKTHAQLKGESTEFYIQDVLRLCKEVDPHMNEQDKISHLMKGIAEELYQALLPRDAHTTQQFVTECHRIEALHCKRVTPTRYERLPNVASLSDHDDRADLSSMIRQIVREEVQRALASPREEPEISAIEHMVQQEIEKTIAPISRSVPQNRAPRPLPSPRYEFQPRNFQPRPQQPKQLNGRRDTNEWRTTEGKPICFHCGRPGHKSQPVASPFPSGKLEDASYFGGKAAKFINPPLSTTLELKENYIDIKIEGKMTRALVDSGASYSVISERFRLKLKKIMFAETDVTLRVANGKIVRPKGRCTLKLDLNGLQESFEFVVMEDCSHEVILGWDFLKLSRAIIDSADDTLFLEKCLFEDTPKNSSPLYSELEYRIEPASIQLIEVASRDIPNDAIVVAECRKELLLERELTAPSSVISLTNNRGKLWVVNWSPYPKLIPQGMHVADSAVIEDSQLCTLADCNQVETEAEHSEDPKTSDFFIDDSLDESQKEKLRNLLKNYTDIFEFNKRKQFKDVNVKHRINTGDHLPTKQRPYRVAPRERQIIQDEVNKMEKLDIIQPSESPWASPVVLIRKKDGSWRFCVDYRRLNKITKKDVYPLPRIDDTLDCLRGARFYSSMDLQSGYWQIDVEESDREKTAFITPDGLYEFKVMPFGLCNAPATFERMIDNLLKGLKWTICLCYLDDIIVFSDGFEEHLRRLQLVLNCLKKAGLCLNSKKCKFGAKTITVLGHEVSENGIRPDQEKIRAVHDFATPRSLKEVRSFLGLSSYYRRFIPNYAHVAQPLNDLLKKDSAFNWNQEEQNAFEALKSALISEPALGHFDYSSPTEIHTDASNYGIGAVLVQIQKGKERAIAYASRTLNKAEKNYSTTERECLAIIWAINKFRPYVFGQPFTIVTDHHSLCWLTNLKDPCGRLARWALRLQEFDVTVVYKSGRKHQDADCLSRSPLEYSEDMEEDIPSIVTLQNFSEEQMNDQALRKIADQLQSTPNNTFVKIDNTVYRKNYDPMGKPWHLVVPRHLRQELLKNFHDSPTAGHLGFTKTYDRIRKKYYWPGMYRTVRKYVAHCSDCQRRKHQPQLPSGHLQPIPVPEVAFEKVGMDLLGRFPTSEGGNRWIIVCTDYLTKYAITKALPTSESMEVAKFFIEDVILKHGAPRELITDRGRNFTSSMISDLNNQCRITHQKTTAYHPQTNGLTERLNKTIADMLSMYVDVNQKDWDRILPFVTFAYNTAKQESTGFIPFFLVHGREAETPLDVLFPKLLPEDDDFIQTLGARAEEARKLARIHSMRSQDSNKQRYDAHHRNIIYQPGDLVWIFIPVRKVGYSEKLMRRYFGPYKVTRKISDVTYEVETFGNQQGHRKTKDLLLLLFLIPLCKDYTNSMSSCSSSCFMMSSGLSQRMKPYLNPEDQEDHLEEDPEDDSTNFQEEDIPTERTQQPQTRVEISGPITRSRALRLK